MTPIARKGVLLRLTPELLDKVDVARGALNRTAWITAVIIARLDAIAEADATLYTDELGEPAPVTVWGAPVHFAVDEEVGTPAEHDVYLQGARDAMAIVDGDGDGAKLPLVVTGRREDGVLEIGHAGGLFSSTQDAHRAGSGTPAGDEPPGEHEGPDTGSHTLDTSRQGNSSEAVRTDGGGDWGGATPRGSADSEELAETVPPFDTSPSGEPADQGYSLPVGPGERGEGSDAALRSSSSEQGLWEPGTTAEGESSKGSDMARDAETTRDVDSPHLATDGAG